MVSFQVFLFYRGPGVSVCPSSVSTHCFNAASSSESDSKRVFRVTGPDSAGPVARSDFRPTAKNAPAVAPNRSSRQQRNQASSDAEAAPESNNSDRVLSSADFPAPLSTGSNHPSGRMPASPSAGFHVRNAMKGQTSQPQARILSITFPATSVSRKRRPL